jgi:hypothetical protein
LRINFDDADDKFLLKVLINGDENSGSIRIVLKNLAIVSIKKIELFDLNQIINGKLLRNLW